MSKVYTDEQQHYLREINRLTKHSPRLNFLLEEIPVMDPEVYTKTTIFHARASYEEAIHQGKTIPHGFREILEREIKTNTVAKIYSLYKKEIDLICSTLEIDVKDIKRLFFEIKKDNDNTLTTATNDALNELNSIIKRFTSKYKEAFIQKIISQRNNALLETTIKIPEQNKIKKLSPEAFLRIILLDEYVYKRLIKMIYESFDTDIDDEEFSKIILQTGQKDCFKHIASILDLQEPPKYNIFLKIRRTRRLQQNFTKQLNKQFKNKTLIEKEIIAKLINLKAKCHKLNTYEPLEEYENLRLLLGTKDIYISEQISVILSKSNAEVKIINNEFQFIEIDPLTEQEYNICKDHQNDLKKLKKLHDVIHSFYSRQNKNASLLLEQTKLKISETDIINRDKWLDIKKIQELIQRIDLIKLELLSEEALAKLKYFLQEDGLLWSYIADNIDLNTISKIINHFSLLYSSAPSLISMNNIELIIKKSNLYDYTDDVLIGLIGLNNLEKIINYNQFSGVKVTKEVINLRLRKIIDLAIRSEYKNKSSLPFNIVKRNNYSAIRYLNNDPQIFTSGIDTKTCFFVSVNENDFFFYSLLSKDGYVVKILNDKGEFVARATCFRKNNVFMINGIRYLNNKTVPTNKDELQEFIKVLEVIEALGKKLIDITSFDECPIDFVVVNRAGILEHEAFNDYFEYINPELLKEPLNRFDEDWQEFVHTYDDADEQLFQEVSETPDRCFTTDFGCHYPAILLVNRFRDKGLTSPLDIKIEDQSAKYTRPRSVPEEFITEEIDDIILAKINRIRALSCFIGDKAKQELRKANYRLIKNTQDIQHVILGDDWCIITHQSGTKEILFSKDEEHSKEALKEIRLFLGNSNEITNHISLKYKKNDN